MRYYIDRRRTMWLIEVDSARRQFTRSVPDRRRPSSRFKPRAMHGRPSQLRSPRAA